MSDLVQPNAAPAAADRPWWLSLLDRVARPFVRIKPLPPAPEQPPLDLSRPVLYVLEHHGLSNLLILDRACREAGMPSPSTRLPGTRRRAVFALSRRRGWFAPRARLSDRSDRLEELLGEVSAHSELDHLQLVPVSIFVGRAPDRESGWLPVLFAENWVVVGRFRRLLALLFNGRNTLVKFSTAIERDRALEPEVKLADSARKLARVLRVHFRRIRAAIIGPDLSHRRMLVDRIVMSPSVRSAIIAQGNKEKGGQITAARKARQFAREIAADYSHTVVRSLSFLLQGFWSRIYDGITLRHFDQLLEDAPGREVIFVPCHRSHIDYLVLSYLLYRHGLVPPHIAAGVNLNLPVVGSILRRGGAFFLRRSFRSNALYSAVFSEYVRQLLRQGVSLEYFIEGGRSRTGRLLQPRAGMLAITLRGCLAEPSRPVLFQPVYIAYEKLLEGKSYIGELSGKPKKAESLWQLLRAVKVLRQRYGKVVVNMGEPIELSGLIEAHSGEKAPLLPASAERPSWFNPLVDDLADRIQQRINQAAHVTPINLVALAILGTPKHAISRPDLLRFLELSQQLLRDLPYGPRVSMTEMAPAEMIDYALQMEWIQCKPHPLGDVLSAEGESGVLLSYFRNNISHLFAVAGWVACCFLNNRRLSVAGVVRMGQQLYPFLKSELFLPWDEEEFARRTEQVADWLVDREVLSKSSDGVFLSRPREGSEAGFMLRIMAHSLLQAFQRYFIALSVLTRNGSGSLTAAQLEKLCYLTAQRLAMLQELSGPEFFDRGLFRGFIQCLRERGVVSPDEQSKLIFGPELEQVAKDARILLGREVRQGIIQMTPEAIEALPVPAE
ncbi:MAG: glycerol-3-phosphate 1-O-acyltransferase PlsB [Xanthomonadales bacterium]|nr:glycerol-3-phosphate 1-O-acyltransferase PlsB [Xanthomonadales bacterium]